MFGYKQVGGNFKKVQKMRVLTILTVLAIGLLTLIFYSTINYLVFKDFGFIPAGRIVFTTNFGYYDYIILPVGLLIGSIIYRRHSNKVAFRQIFSFGFQTTIQASFLFSAFIFVYLQFIEPDFFNKLIELIQTETTGKELTPLKQEVLIRAKSIEETELYRSPYFYSIANFFVYFFVGTISSLLFATLLKKKLN